jgi:hypothetical protein
MDIDMDDSHFGVAGIARVCCFAAAVALWRAANWMLTPEHREEMNSTAPALALEADELSTREQESDLWTVFLAVLICLAVAHNFMHVRRNTQRSPADVPDVTQGRPAAAGPAAPHPPSVGTREIFDAVSEEDTARLEYLLSQPLTLKDGVTPRASRVGIDFISPIGQRTALIDACVRGRSGLARMLLEAGADCSIGDNCGWTARDWARIHTLVPGDEEARTVLKLLEARHRRRAARRRWKAVGRSLDAVFGLWAVVKERRYAPDGAGFEVAREHFESCREAMADGCQRSGEAMAAAPRAQ